MYQAKCTAVRGGMHKPARVPVQTTCELGYEVGNIYATMRPRAPEALDLLGNKFQDHFTLTNDVIQGVFKAKTKRALATLAGETQKAVCIVWAVDVELSREQKGRLDQIMENCQPRGKNEPGWWLWNGVTALCTPWDVLPCCGSFAQSSHSGYKYPWS